MIRRLLSRLLATRIVHVPAEPVDEAALIRQIWEETRSTPEDQAVIDELCATPLPEVTPEMRDRAVARFEAEFPPAAEVRPRSAAAAPKTWPTTGQMWTDVELPDELPPIDYPAPLPPGTATGPGFARYDKDGAQ